MKRTHIQQSLLHLLFLLSMIVLPGIFRAQSVVRLDINSSIQLGMKYNTDMRYFGEELQIQMFTLREQKRSYFPQLNLQLSDNDSVALDSSDSRSQSVSVSLSQLIYDGGKLRNQVNDAQISLILAQLESDRKRLDFTESIMNAYLSLLQQQERYLLRDELFQNQKKELSLSQRKYQLGEATILEYYEWEIQVGQSRLDLLELSNSMEFEMINYKKMLGLGIDREVDLILKVNEYAVLEKDYLDEADILQNTLSYSLDLKKIRLSMKQARINSIQKKQFIPSVSVNASYSTALDRPFRPGDQWNLGFQIQLPLFSDQVSLNTGLGGDFKGQQKSFQKGASTSVYQDPSYSRQILQQNISLDKLKFQYNDTVTGIRVEVKKIVSDLDIQYQKLNILEQQIRLSEAKLLIMRKQLDLGELKVSEYIEFQNSLNSKKIDQLDARFSYLKSLIKVKKLQGMLDAGGMEDIYSGFFVKKEGY